MKPGWRGREFWTATFAGVLAAVFLPNGFYGDGVSEIVTVLGFVMAALVPAMALAATSIRAGGFSVKRIRALGAAVETQIKVFAGLFLYSLAACILAILGKLLKWTTTPIPVHVLGYETIGVGWLFPGLLTFMLTFIVLRSGTFIAGILSILRLTTAVAEDEARARDDSSGRAGADDLETYAMPKEYGSRVEAIGPDRERVS